MENIPTSTNIGLKSPELSSVVTDYNKTIDEIKLWLLGLAISNDGMSIVKDSGLEPVMSVEGAKAYCSWLETLTAKPIPLSKQKHNTVARRLIFYNAATLKMLIENEEDWNLNFDKYCDTLVEIADALATSALSGSIDGFILQKLTEHLMINETRNSEENKGFNIRSIFGRRKNVEH